MPLNKEMLLTGNVGRGGVEAQYTAQGKLVGKFSLAVTSGWGDNKTTEWYECVAWEKTAETLNEYLGQGSRVQVRGPFELQTFEGKNGWKAKIVVTVKDFQFLSAKKEREETEDEPEFMRD